MVGSHDYAFLVAPLFYATVRPCLWPGGRGCHRRRVYEDLVLRKGHWLPVIGLYSYHVVGRVHIESFALAVGEPYSILARSRDRSGGQLGLVTDTALFLFKCK